MAPALNRLAAIYRSNPDYYAAVFTGYFLIGANILVQLLLVPLYIEHLGKYDFGILMILLGFINYAAMGVGWMSGSVSRVLGEFAAVNDSQGFGQAYHLAKLIYDGYAIIAGLIFVLAVLFWGDHIFDTARQTDKIVYAVIAAAIYFVILYDFSVERLALNAKRRQTIANIFQALNVIGFAILVVPWLIYGGGLVGVFGCLLASVLAARLASLLYWRHIGGNYPTAWWGNDSYALLKRMAGKLGLGYFLYGMLSLTLLQADVMIIAWLGGAEAAAEFVIVWKIASVVVQLIWALPEYLAPQIIHHDVQNQHDRINSLKSVVNKWLFSISAIAALGYALLGGWLVEVWVGEQPAVDQPYIFVLGGLAIFFLGIARFPSILAYSTMKLRPLNLLIFAELVLKLVFTILLFPYVGIAAPIVGLVLAHVLGVAIGYQILLRRSGRAVDLAHP